MNWFCRVLTFHHIFPLREYFLNKKLGNQSNPTIPLHINQNYNFVNIVQKIQKLLKEKLQSQALTERIFFQIIIQSFKYQFIVLFLGCFFESLLRLASSIIILFLIQSLQQKTLEKSYILSIILICSLFLISIIQNNWYCKGKNIYSYIQSAITMICYKSILNLKQNTVNNCEIGKIINIISCDFNNTQSTFIYIFFVFVSPFIILASACIFVYNLGWLGLIAMMISTLNIFLQGLISKKTSSILDQLNKFKDKRIEYTEQVIGGIRYAKLYNYEIEYGNKIKQFRQKQSSYYLRNWFYEGLEKALILACSNLGLLITLIVVYYFNQSQLNLNNIFSSLSVISFYRDYIWCVHDGVKNIFQSKIIFKRFIQIYTTKQSNQVNLVKQQNQVLGSFNKLNNHQIKNNDLQVGQIKFTDYSARWTKDGFQLKNINLSIKPGKIYGIGGVIGSGKSTLLSAILKQIPMVSNGYCQSCICVTQPCLFTGTVKENILFGMEWNEILYRQVLERSCLLQDLKILTEGDSTKVGEKGVTLSGGQKARISLARALYSQADIYLLDDPLSGLDTKTNKYMFENVLKGDMLKGKTIILVTHLMSYIQKCDTILIMSEGQILNRTNNMQTLSTTIHKMQVKNKSAQMQIVKEDIANKSIQNVSDQNAQVNFSTFLRFITYSRRYVFIILISFIYIFSEGIMVGYLRLLSMYDKMNSPQLFKDNIFWTVLVSLIICYLVLIMVRSYFFSELLVSCINNIHDDMLWGVVRSPLKFYDITSSSMLINKFSNDINVMDTSLILQTINLIQGIIIIIISFVNIAEVLPFFLIPCIASLILCIVWFMYWKDVIIYSQENVLQSKTPIYQQILFLTQNLTQVHIYKQEQNVQKRMVNQMEQYIVQKNSSIALTTIFRLYINYFSVLMTCAAILLGLKFVNNAGSYAMCIVILIEIQDLIDYYGSIFLSLQNIFVSVARCLSICGLQTEADLTTQYDKTIGVQKEIEEGSAKIIKQSSWPQNSTIEYKNFTMRYKSDFEPALKNINLKIEEGTKVAFIGRTGSGKSSMIQSLFRMYESDNQSQLFIGGCNAKLMGLRTLRSSLSIIPQSSFIFRGTIRENIDPFSQYSDEEVWNVLQECKLKECIHQLKQQINTQIDNDLETFSVGQKQLICLARVLIKNNKIVVLDEATSNIDLETQSFIHEMLKKKFRGKTIITIAHRLETIADYDRVIVMQKGRIAEEGNLFKLLAVSESDKQITSNGIFAEMVKNTNSKGQGIFDIAKCYYLRKTK